MKRVLDPCCGSRMFWFDKNNPDVEFCDIREFEDTLCDGRKLSVAPDTIADFTNLPFEDNTFWHIVFDPPHMTSLGENSWMAKKYGVLKVISYTPMYGHKSGKLQKTHWMAFMKEGDC